MLHPISLFFVVASTRERPNLVWRFLAKKRYTQKTLWEYTLESGTSANLILVTTSGAMYRFILTSLAVVVLVNSQHNHPTSKSTKRSGIKFPKTHHNTPNGANILLGSTRRPVLKSARPATDLFTPYPTDYGCLYEGKWYRPGSDVSRGYDGKSWCFGLYCDLDSNLILWDNFKCSTTQAPVATTISTTITPTTLTPTATPDRPTTVPSPTPEGCYYNGKWFPPNTEISRGSSYGWCYGTYCDAQGDVVAWDDWSCSTTSPPTTTAPYMRTTTPQSTTEPPSGCLFEGWLYDFGSDISQIWNGGERCYGKRCSNDGEIITWLYFGCKTIQNYFKNNGCRYGGHFYHRGIEIFRKTPSGRCYESTCGKNGLRRWNPLSCNEERQFLSGYGGSRTCSYRGTSYPRGSIIYSRSLYRSHGYGWCVGAKCGRNGRVIAWGPVWTPGYC